MLLAQQAELRIQSRKESDVFEWSRIPKKTRSRSRIFIRLQKSNWNIFYVTHLWL